MYPSIEIFGEGPYTSKCTFSHTISSTLPYRKWLSTHFICNTWSTHWLRSIYTNWYLCIAQHNHQYLFRRMPYLLCHIAVLIAFPRNPAFNFLCNPLIELDLVNTVIGMVKSSPSLLPWYSTTLVALSLTIANDYLLISIVSRDLIQIVDICIHMMCSSSV